MRSPAHDITCIVIITLSLTQSLVSSSLIYVSADAAGGGQKSRTSTKKSQEPAASSRKDRASTGGCQQPDLVQVTVSGAAQHTEIDRLEGLVESSAAQVTRLEARHEENMIGSEVMSVMLAHLSHKVSVISSSNIYVVAMVRCHHSYLWSGL